MKKIFIIIVFIMFGCVPKTIIKEKPFELCPASDIVVIGNYEGFMFPMLLKKGVFNDPSESWMTVEEWEKITKEKVEE